MSSARFFHAVVVLLALAVFSGCQTVESRQRSDARDRMQAAILSEPPGDYYVGRRYYKKDYKFWGYVRRPQQPWSTAKLVMMNEQQKLAPDRAQNSLGSDNNHEYKLYGSLSSEPTTYEPASNGFYHEFMLQNYELKSVAPGNIYREPGATDPARRIIATPY